MPLRHFFLVTLNVYVVIPAAQLCSKDSVWSWSTISPFVLNSAAQTREIWSRLYEEWVWATGEGHIWCFYFNIVAYQAYFHIIIDTGPIVDVLSARFGVVIANMLTWGTVDTIYKICGLYVRGR